MFAHAQVSSATGRRLGALGLAALLGGCSPAAGDAAFFDAAEPDAHLIDAVPQDAAPADAVPADATPADAEPRDASATDAARPDAARPDAAPPPRCPPDTADLGAVCMDRYEAPNRAGSLPLVMYTFYEAEAWCASRGRRLCFDDEWTAACAGADGTAWPYGDAHMPGACNDDKRWLTYQQPLLNGWPPAASAPEIETLDALLDGAAGRSASARAAAEHVRALYQGEPAGANEACTNASTVFDLTGNVEEWTRRRDGGEGRDFSGNLKGRYWAEPRTCQSGVRTHGNGFRFYEIGWRCCLDPPP